MLAQLAAQVYTVERIGALAEGARCTLQALGLGRVEVLHGDGSTGWREHAPFDAISVAAAAPSVPAALMQQLRLGGRMVIPVGTGSEHQQLVCLTRLGAQAFHTENITAVRFVPLLGSQGWPTGEASG